MKHGSTPDNWLIFFNKETHRDAPNAMRFGWHDHFIDDRWRVIHTKHARDRESPDIGVDNGDLVAALRESN
jgi:hypothetical protein